MLALVLTVATLLQPSVPSYAAPGAAQAAPTVSTYGRAPVSELAATAPSRAPANGADPEPAAVGRTSTDPDTDAALDAALDRAPLWGWIHSSGGPELADSSGRVVFLHGVNAVDKRAPYVLTTRPGHESSFTAADAAHIAALGFNVVRVGILWQGLEPGTLGPNSSRACSAGAPRDPDQYNGATVDAYIDKVARIVSLLAHDHIYTLLDMHEDVVSSVFGGEGAPPWAVCTDGLPIRHLPGRWSRTYADAALGAAATNFWANDVSGNLQGEFIRVWQAVATQFRNDPAVLGYDLLNEPFSPVLAPEGSIATQVECFYTGTAHPGLGPNGPLACPRHDPAVGLVPAIEAVDPNHLLFFEPDIFNAHHHSDNLVAMPYPRLVFNFHAYCPGRDPVTGDPYNVAVCAARLSSSLARRLSERTHLASPAQPDGPAAFLSEFGATDSAALDARVVAAADREQLSWTTWTWKSYDDPTGSSDEALVSANGQVAPEVTALSEPYPQAVAGDPIAFAYDPGTDRFTLSYAARPTTAPTDIYVPVAMHYPDGYCARVTGGRVLSARNAGHLVVANRAASGRVSVAVDPGPCLPPTAP
jgi:endoglycosylceramidase